MAQPTLQFQNFTQRDGLASDYVLGILEDHLGFIWIGTENGLNRFDGQHFLRFHSNPEDPATLNNNWILGLFEDSRHNLWVSTVLGLNRLELETGIIERVPLLHDGQPVVTPVNNVLEAPTGDLWVVTPFSGLFKLAPPQKGQPWQAEHFSYENSHNWNKRGPRLINIALATADELWLVHSSGIDKLHLPSRQTTSFPVPAESQFRDNEQDPVGGLFDGRQRIFIGLNQELYLLDITEDKPELRSFERSALAPDQAFNITRNFLMENPQTLLIPFYKDLALLDLHEGTYQLIKKAGQLEDGLFFNPIHALYKDERGNYWVGTSGGGLYFGQQAKDPFTFYRNDPANPRSISEGQVRSLLEDDHGHLWIGILNQGLDQLIRQEDGTWQRNTTLTTAFDQPNSSVSDRVIKIIQGEGQSIWVATNNGGLIHVDSTGNPLASYTHQPNDPASLSGNRIWGLARDQNGYIWAGTWQYGLNRLDPRTGLVKQFRHDPADPGTLGNDHIRYLYFDRQDILWIGTHDGLGRYDPQTDRFTHYRHDPDDTLSLSHNMVWAICEDQEGQLWVGTNTGLNRFDPRTQTFKRYFEQDGLPDNTIYGVLEDDDGHLWVSTENGLAREFPGQSAPAFQSLGHAHGLEMASFLPKALLNSAHSDALFFGGTRGLLEVRPSRIVQDTSSPRLVLHAMTRLPRKAGSGKGVIDYFLTDQEGPIHLGYEDQSVVFILADLHRLSNNSYQYEYKLQGFNQQWIPLEENMQVTFTNLPAGRYTLQARAKDLNNTYLEVVDLLRLQVHPPWWNSWWAYLIYLLLLGTLTGWFIRSHLRRQLAKQEAENLRALDAFKNKLFTNITHEFRTPLTIISGMVDQIRKHPDRWLEEGTAMVLKNTNSLLDLVNQILELQKLESGQVTLALQHGDIIPFLQTIFRQFQAFAQSKNQQLTFHCALDELPMDYDPGKVLRIVSNLLSNAIKYTPEQGAVHFSVSSGERPDFQPSRCLILDVQDTGPGIPEEQLPRIFDRFFRVTTPEQANESGTGIGLSLTQELVKVLRGRIEVSSQVGQGTRFQVFLPITREAAPAPAQDLAEVRQAIFGTQPVTLPIATETNVDQPLALIVEDNPDIAQYLQICLEGSYQIEVAYDGQQGITLALERIPDIIVSDVMMPRKDGFELCETLRENIRTSHIPIILLTAKSDVASRITGLKHGADDYLGKPFHEEELLVRMQNLLNIRRKLQERYQNLYAHPLPEQKEESPSREDEFILKLKEMVEAHLDDPDFDLDALSQALFLSRSQLGRKVKALTGRSPALFLRSIRLQKAKQLLLTTDLPVKEIGYEVGFSNPVHFSRSYAEEFGESPTNTRELGQMRK